MRQDADFRALDYRVLESGNNPDKPKWLVNLESQFVAMRFSLATAHAQATIDGNPSVAVARVSAIEYLMSEARHYMDAVNTIAAEHRAEIDALARETVRG